MSVSFVDVFSFLRELISNNDKLLKFKEIVADIKELIVDIKSLLQSIKG